MRGFARMMAGRIDSGGYGGPVYGRDVILLWRKGRGRYLMDDMMEVPAGLKEWAAAVARREVVCAEVRGLYAEIQGEIDRKRPLCVMSGRCCRFEEYGHRMFVTTAELGAFMAELGEELGDVERNGPQGGCVFQTGKICRVHRIRPMGCRVFFCDPGAQEWQKEVYERYHARLKEIHERLEIPYCYVEWRAACGAMGWED